MAPVSAGAQKMNQFLKERRQKMNKDKKFRKQRIIKHYHKALTSYDQELQSKLNPSTEPSNNSQTNPQIQRKINFYNSVFQEPHVNARLNKKNKNKNKKDRNHQNNNQPLPKDQKILVQEKLNNLKDKKVKFIKKMSQQKTAKGQPVMRNMISYALTKIEETIHKEKLQKLINDQNAKKQPQKQNQSKN